MTEQEKKKIERILEKKSGKFYHTLVKKQQPTPSIFELMIFRMTRISVKLMLNNDFKDYRYYKKNGWFESDYYYLVKLNPLKKMLGRFFEFLAT